MPLVFHRGREAHSTSEREGSLLALARIAGLPMGSSCGGRGTCGACTVFLEQGRFEVLGATIDIQPGERREVLACETKYCGGDAAVTLARLDDLRDEGACIAADFYVPSGQGRPVVRCHQGHSPQGGSSDARSLSSDVAEQVGVRDVDARCISPALARAGHGDWTAIVAAGSDAAEVLDVRSGTHDAPPLALAVDIGTSTVAMALIDPVSGTTLGRHARFNQQALCGDDVAARITAASTGSGLRNLNELLVDHTLRPMMEALCEAHGRNPGEIYAVAVCGNTVMSHLLLCLPPDGIGAWPFRPVTREFPGVRAGELRWPVHPRAPVFVAPAISGYVGGDIVADLVVSRLGRDDERALLIDIGTNGEMVLADRGRLIACATAAGPAFEGAGLTHGCRAVRGSIERIDIAPDLTLRCFTVGDAPPVGVCGSAVIDFLACAREVGLINEMGRFDRDVLRRTGRETRCERRGHATLGCRLVSADESATGAELLISEADIAQVLKAKAAIYAGARILLERAGCRPAELDRLVLAGGFARHIRLDRAIRLGLLPDIAADRIEVIGNGSLAGAVLALLDATAQTAFHALIDRVEVVELNLDPGFADHFADAMAIPHRDPEAFPSLSITEKAR